MQRRASVEFCWASLRTLPCHSPHPAHPIGISKYPSPIVRPQFCSRLLFITVLLLRIQWLTERRKGELENEERGGWTVMDPHIPTLLVGDKPSTRDGVSSYEMRFATLFLFSCYCPAPPRASRENAACPCKTNVHGRSPDVTIRGELRQAQPTCNELIRPALGSMRMPCRLRLGLRLIHIFLLSSLWRCARNH